jgi:hypothetical protein
MKTRILQLWIGALILALATTGCMDDLFIRGNGITLSETRFARPFSEVNSSGNFIVHVSPGDNYEIVVNAESNLLPYIETDIRNGRLNISVAGIHNLRNTRPMEVFVVTPYLDAVRMSGSGEITTGYFDTERFEAVISGSGLIETAVDARSAKLVISGSGYIDIFGKVRSAEMILSGSGKIFAYDLALLDCNATISGSGDMYVNANRNLEVRLSGSGNLFYIGNPIITSTVSGSGKIFRDR